jgi:uncharacterized membrane protein
MDVKRMLRHLFFLPHRVRRAFPPKVLDAVEAVVAEAERLHRGEIRMAVEGALDGTALWRGQSARERAIDVFSLLRVWDTELNTGVLVYVLLADRAVEIVADRGIAAKVAQAQWDAICHGMETAFAQGRFQDGAVEGMRAIAALLGRHFDRPDANPNELPNRPVVL